MEEVIRELKTLAKECRLHARGRGQTIALNRLSKKLDSLAKSYDPTVLAEDNPLTARELEVLEFVSLGFTNREIASSLHISAKTIEYHLGSIYRKTQASGRAEAVRNAINSRWLAST